MKMTKTAVLVLAVSGVACSAKQNTHKEEDDHPPAHAREPSGAHPATGLGDAFDANRKPSTIPAAHEGREDSDSPSVKEQGDAAFVEQSGASLAGGSDDASKSSETVSTAIPVHDFSLNGHGSIHQALGGANTSVALFSVDDGVIAIDERGGYVRIFDEPFDQIVIDYALGILWLDRYSSPVDKSGLFVVDIFGSDLSPTKVTRLTKGYEIVGLDGVPLPMTQGAKPYRVIMDNNRAMRFEVIVNSPVVCGDECSPSEESVSVMSAAIERYATHATPTPGVELLPLPAGSKQTTLKNGTMLDIPGFPVVLRYVRRRGNHGFGWQLYDKKTKEYIDSVRFERSSEPWLAEVNHLMICDGGHALVVNQAFFDSDFRRLDTGNNYTYGVCLGGGLLFQNRTGFTFTDHASNSPPQATSPDTEGPNSQGPDRE